MTTALPQREITPRQALRAVAATCATGLALGGVYLLAGVGIPCPFLALTGWQCPFCGGTRLVAALMSGQIARAWSFNPLLLVVGVGLAIRSAGWLVDLARGRGDRPSVRWLPRRMTEQWVAVAGGVGVVYVVARHFL